MSYKLDGQSTSIKKYIISKMNLFKKLNNIILKDLKKYQTKFFDQ
jgi:hypothetical protein